MKHLLDMIKSMKLLIWISIKKGRLNGMMALSIMESGSKEKQMEKESWKEMMDQFSVVYFKTIRKNLDGSNFQMEANITVNLSKTKNGGKMVKLKEIKRLNISMVVYIKKMELYILGLSSTCSTTVEASSNNLIKPATTENS